MNEAKRNELTPTDCYAESWVDVENELPSVKNQHIDTLVLVRVKNKNKPDGIWLYDICAFDGESWCERLHTWERITHWKSIA